jgi:hypothetical protein
LFAASGPDAKRTTIAAMAVEAIIVDDAFVFIILECVQSFIS